MTRSSLKERIARLGPPLDIGRVVSGSPVAIAIRCKANDRAKSRTVDAALALVRRGLSMRAAKRAIEAVLAQDYAALTVPVVEDARTLASELSAAGFAASVLAAHAVDVGALRGRLHLTQEQFALRFGVDLDTLQNWEQGRSSPSPLATAYLRVIERFPAEAALAQEMALAEGQWAKPA